MALGKKGELIVTKLKSNILLHIHTSILLYGVGGLDACASSHLYGVAAQKRELSSWPLIFREVIT